jgi:hypothetical protein
VGAFFKERTDDDDVELFGQLAHDGGGGAGDGFGEVEQVGLLFAAEVLGAEQLLQADDLGAAGGGLRAPFPRLFLRFSPGEREQDICTRPTRKRWPEALDILQFSPMSCSSRCSTCTCRR